MSQESRKQWARTGIVRHLQEAHDAIVEAQAYEGPLPQNLSNRLLTLKERCAGTYRAVQKWPVTLEERAQARAAKAWKERRADES